LTIGVAEEAVHHLKIAERALMSGCEGVRRDRKILCESASSSVTESMFFPINAFCPGMCSCNTTVTESCPMSCGAQHLDWEDYFSSDDASDEGSSNYEDYLSQYYGV